MSLKKSELRQIEKERARFMKIMEITLEKLNKMRLSKFQSILQNCPDSQCANECMQSYNEVNNEVDKFLNGMTYELAECVRIEKEIKPAALINCFSKFEYIIRYEVSKLNLE